MSRIKQFPRRPGMPTRHPRPAQGGGWQQNLESTAAAERLSKGPLRLTPDETMFFGKHKGLTIRGVCLHHPAYMHYLIRENKVVATRELCDLIQKGYDAQARRLSQQYGPIGKGLNWKWTPIAPAQAPEPTE